MKKAISILTATAIVFQVFTPIRQYFEGGRALMMLLPALTIVVYDKLFIRRSFWPMFLYLLTCVIIMLSGSTYFSLPSLISIFFAYTCLEHFLVSHDLSYAKMVSVSLYGTLIVLISISLPLFIAMPNLSRLMIDAEENGIQTPILYWTISYPTIHELPVYSIPVLYLLKNSGKLIIRLFALIFIVAIFLLMLFADSTTALIINVTVLGILLFYNQKKSLKANIGRMTSLGVVLVVLLNKTVLIGLLTAVQPVFSGGSTYQKIDEIVIVLNGGEKTGDIAGREEKLNLSWKSFVENPLLPTIEGDTYEKIGGHNFIFDQIVAMGLIFGMTFIWFLLERIKRPWKFLTFTARPYYIVGVLAMLIMGAMKNFFLLMPACCILPIVLIAKENQSFNTVNSKI